MVYCGVDIIETERIVNSFKTGGNAFRDRVYTIREIEYCESRKVMKFESYAARFAAKEAVSKALGTGMADGIRWKEIEVRNDGNGKPEIILTGRAKTVFDELKGRGISLSLSHCKLYAVAFAVIET